MAKEMVLSLSDFSYLCPALLNQIDTTSCILHPEDRLQTGIHLPSYFNSYTSYLLCWRNQFDYVKNYILIPDVLK